MRKHYFSPRHLNINLCDLFISPDVPLQSRLHQLSNREPQLYFLSACLVNCSFLISIKKKKLERGRHVWLLQQRQKVLKFHPDLPLLVKKNRCFSSAKLPIPSLITLRRKSAPLSYQELSLIICKTQFMADFFPPQIFHSCFHARRDGSPPPPIVSFHISNVIPCPNALVRVHGPIQYVAVQETTCVIN